MKKFNKPRNIWARIKWVFLLLGSENNLSIISFNKSAESCSVWVMKTAWRVKNNLNRQNQ